MLQLPVTIEGRYRLEAIIASGGFATVYLATQLAVQRRVAVKVISPPPGQEAWMRRAEREAVVLGRLKHPATVTVFDYGDWDGLLYLVMEYVEGDTLHRRVREQGPLSWQQTARLTLDMLGSLGEAHKQGILHRDLKPSNIIISTDTRGRLHGRVLDFGIAALMPSEELPVQADGAPITQDGFIGTPRYASPEQLTGQALAPTSDLYAVGLIMWECLVGKAAVTGNRIDLCLNAHLGAQPWQLPPTGAPAELVRLIERALDKDASRRWQSAEEMSVAIEATLAGESGDASLRSGEFARAATAVIDPNLDPSREVPELLTEPPPSRQSRRERAVSRLSSSSAPLAAMPPLAEQVEPALARRPIVREPLPRAPVDHGATLKLLGCIVIAGAVAASLLIYARHREQRAAEQRAAIAADTPALLNLPPVQAPAPPAPMSIDGMLSALEADRWVLEAREAPMRLGKLEVSDVIIKRDGALVVLTIAASPSRDQIEDYLRPSKRDRVVYSGLYAIRIVGKNSAGRQALGEVEGRLELWRALVERESARKD